MVELGHKRIYIVPTKAALGLVVVILLLFLLGVNFQNALVYAVCFWLLALLLLNLFYTWRNLLGLQLTAVGIEPCFAGEMAVLEVELRCQPQQRKFALTVAWEGQDETQTDLVSSQVARVKLSHPTRMRGRFEPPRLCVRSRYPTGLALAWAYFVPPVRGLVYPRPLAQPLLQHGQATLEQHEDGVELAGGSSDFGGIREYQVGDAPKRIHWGKVAQTGKLYTKSFVDYASHEVWLDWDSLPLRGIEARLSHLCSQVLAFHQAQRQYGLKLPGKMIPPGKGEAHKALCLQALALYGVTDG